MYTFSYFPPPPLQSFLVSKLISPSQTFPQTTPFFPFIFPENEGGEVSFFFKGSETYVNVISLIYHSSSLSLDTSIFTSSSSLFRVLPSPVPFSSPPAPSLSVSLLLTIVHLNQVLNTRNSAI